ncbi:glycosyltransferase family 2 protein [Flavobacterium collinsii]|uniref:Glyco_trans_2-like domain-containing protein n=1 Tax=Flavobacterium collinsii TaxID=1114861 RepID=A0A9W4TE34_9FLAO|nr:glycosyltransferase family A protein [Flavobacterium collinsii]CAA9202810.1 hypothetical protein FLACOL7796_04454 [Flavobacterium collinsii]CAI2765395.1 Glyco_trans_2-like domain-containing protein [Flavobacterium collinsii]
MNTLVSIVVPCYKQAKYLDECLRSVLNQTYYNWECIIINDGSPDKTEIVAQKWVEKDTRFKYLFQENKGVSAARNNAISNASGEFIVALDADDSIAKDYLEKLVPELENDASLAIVSCYSVFFKNNIENVITEFKPHGDNYQHLRYVNQLIVTSLFRKECWHEVNGFDEDMEGFEDWEFWLNITKRGWKYKIVEDFLFFYRKAKKSRQVDALEKHFYTTKEYIFKKHKECYIEDFENCMIVLFFEQNMLKNSQNKIQNSIEYKIVKAIYKPYRVLQRIWNKK